MLVLPARTIRPRRYRPGNVASWSGHLPFVHDLIAAVRPSLVVELGTHYGESYFAMCQAVQENAISCKCYAIDTWKGDGHAGTYDESVFEEVNKYNEDNYAASSKLLRTTFDAALDSFGEQTVDLLHIDGVHTYKAVCHDFETWFPKVRPGGVVLLHDTTARHADFGVWRLWEELAHKFPHFEFTHSWGLGVLQKPGGPASDSLLRTLLSGSTVEQEFLRHYYSSQALVLERRALDRESAAPVRTRFSVFPNLAGGYSESTAVRTTLAPGEWHHVVLELMQGSGRGRIRVDPAERPCLIQIAGVLLRRALDGAVVRDWSTAGAMQAFSPSADLVRLRDNDGLYCLSTGGDPQLLLPELEHALADQPLIFEARVRISENLAPAVSLLQSDAVSVADESADRATLEKLLQSKTAECETALKAASTALAERDAALNEREAALRRVQQLSAEVRNLQAERVAVVAEYRRVHATNEALQNRITSDEQRWLREQAALTNELDVMQRSRSWRITAPLRAFFRAIR
jgi:Methyltransferase domain